MNSFFRLISIADDMRKWMIHEHFRLRRNGTRSAQAVTSEARPNRGSKPLESAFSGRRQLMSVIYVGSVRRVRRPGLDGRPRRSRIGETEARPDRFDRIGGRLGEPAKVHDHQLVGWQSARRALQTSGG